MPAVRPEPVLSQVEGPVEGEAGLLRTGSAKHLAFRIWPRGEWVWLGKWTLIPIIVRSAYATRSRCRRKPNSKQLFRSWAVLVVRNFFIMLERCASTVFSL